MCVCVWWSVGIVLIWCWWLGCKIFLFFHGENLNSCQREREKKKKKGNKKFDIYARPWL